MQNWVYIEWKQGCTESKQLSSEDLKAAEYLNPLFNPLMKVVYFLCKLVFIQYIPDFV